MATAALGVHNGGISNHGEMSRKYKEKLEVDSMWIFWHLANHKPLDELEGYGAVAFFENGVPMLAKFGGQLSIYQLGTDDGIIFSSDEDHIKKALISWGYTIGAKNYAQKYDVDDRVLYSYKDGILIKTQDKFDVSSSGSRWNKHTKSFANTTTYPNYQHHTDRSYFDKRTELRDAMYKARVICRIQMSPLSEIRKGGDRKSVV